MLMKESFLLLTHRSRMTTLRVFPVKMSHSSLSTESSEFQKFQKIVSTIGVFLLRWSVIIENQKKRSVCVMCPSMWQVGRVQTRCFVTLSRVSMCHISLLVAKTKDAVNRHDSLIQDGGRSGVWGKTDCPTRRASTPDGGVGFLLKAAR